MMDNSYFAENDQNPQSMSKKTKSVSIPTLIISIITTVFVVIIIFNNWDNILEIFGDNNSNIENEMDIPFVVWEQVSLSWEISDDWDLVNYTHILNLEDQIDLGLKSKTINLNNYDGNVFVEGIVEKIQHDVPVVEVDAIYSLDDIIEEEELVETWTLQETWDIKESKYMNFMWLYLNENFFDNYMLLNEGEWNILKVKNLQTHYITNIDYFQCNSSSNQNCEELSNVFESTAVEKFTDSNWVKYYKQSEVNSRFVNNDNKYWYFINDSTDEELKKLSSLFVFVNQKYIEDEILENIDLVCWESGKALKEIDEYELSIENNQTYLDIYWDDLYCKIQVDPLTKNWAKLISLEDFDNGDKGDDIEDDVEDENGDGDDDVKEDNLQDDEDLVIWDESVEQFPINLNKALEFTSRRGHTIVFPSSNIAYAWSSVSEDFDQDGVNCFSAMNVVQYSEKEEVNDRWNVVIYECSVKDWFDDSAKDLIYKNIDWNHFVIKVVNPAWIDFANNLEIEYRS